MHSLGYKSCLADPDLWLKAKLDEHGKESFSYILCYVDGIMVIHHKALPILEKINKFMKLKKSPVGDPDIYLGAKLRLFAMPNEVKCWGISPSKYFQEAVRNCEDYIKENLNKEYKLIRNAPNSFSLHYEPSMDISSMLEPEAVSYYQTSIGVLRLMVELGSVDIATEVSQLSSHVAVPRRGHFVNAL